MTDTKYYLLKWKQSMLHRGWSRYEVRPMPAVQDDRYDVVEVNLSFVDANDRRKMAEEVSTKQEEAERRLKLMGGRGGASVK